MQRVWFDAADGCQLEESSPNGCQIPTLGLVRMGQWVQPALGMSKRERMWNQSHAAIVHGLPARTLVFDPPFHHQNSDLN